MRAQAAITGIWLAWRDTPFAWGAADCLAFCGACAKQATGWDPGASLRRRYRSEIGARRVMAAEGWRDMGNVAASLVPEVHPSRAATGDWAHVRDDDGRDGLGVVVGERIAVRTEAGMAQVPLGRALRVFRP